MVEFNLCGRNITFYSSNVECVYLFGSTARGDNDRFSDIDILIVIDDCDEDAFIETKINLSGALGMPADWLSLYRISSIKNMYEYGSYFLWHIKLEGIKLYSKSGIFERLLLTLPTYKKAKEDLLEYLNICKDISDSIKIDDKTLSYELSVLASLTRNTCIALSYINHNFEFGRTSVIISCQKIMGDKFPFALSEYEELYKYRICYTRSTENQELPLKEPSVQMVNKWIINVKLLIEYALACLKGDK